MFLKQGHPSKKEDRFVGTRTPAKAFFFCWPNNKYCKNSTDYLIRLRVKLRAPTLKLQRQRADAKDRFNSSVLALFFESRACSGVHTN